MITTSTAQNGLGESIIEGLRRHDPAALATLYDLIGGRAFGLAYRILGDRCAAEDAIQDAFLALWRHSSKLDRSRGEITSLLMTMVHHRSIDLLRARRGPLARNIDVDWLGIQMPGPDVLELACRAIDRDVVRRAVELLPGGQRAAVEMAYFQGLTAVEIADSCGVPVGTVKSRLRLALEKLKSAVGAAGSTMRAAPVTSQ